MGRGVIQWYRDTGVILKYYKGTCVVQWFLGSAGVHG
jgi:hypothetical protein